MQHNATIILSTLPETNMAPENGWLEDEKISFGIRSLFRGKLAVKLQGGFVSLSKPRRPMTSRKKKKSEWMFTTRGVRGAQRQLRLVIVGFLVGF